MAARTWVLALCACGCVRAGWDRSSDGRGVAGDSIASEATHAPDLDRLADWLAPDRFVDDGPLPPALATCASCADPLNVDCDGLSTGRDPYPQACNSLLFEDHFTAPPNSSSWVTSPTGPGSWSWSTSWYHQTATGGSYPDPAQMAWARSHAAAPPLQANGSDYLVEARVRLGAIGNANVWGVGVVARDTYPNPLANIVCELRVDKLNGGNPGGPLLGTPAVANPDVRIEVRANATSWSAGWPLSRDSTVDGGDGQVYLLQLWYTSAYLSDPKSPLCQPTNTCKALVCRVCEPSKCLRSGIYGFWLVGDPSNPDMSLLPTAPGSVGLRTYGRAASFDYIRVYRLTNP